MSGTTGLSPRPMSWFEFLFNEEVKRLKRERSLLSNAKVSEWTRKVLNKLSAHIALREGNAYALGSCLEEFPCIPDDLSPKEKQELSEILAVLKKSAGYLEVKIPPPSA